MFLEHSIQVRYTYIYFFFFYYNVTFNEDGFFGTNLEKTQSWDAFTRDNNKLTAQFKVIKCNVLGNEAISKSNVTFIRIYHQINI